MQVQMLDSHHTGEVTFQDFCRYITLLPDAQASQVRCLGQAFAVDND